MCNNVLAVRNLAIPSLFIASGFCGCSQSIPAPSQGVLSTIHQKTIGLATERALQQAEVSSENLGQHSVHLEFVEIADSDLGKRHAGRVARDCFRKASGSLVEGNENADWTIQAELLTTGVDVKNGAFFGFSWLETTAEVQIRLEATTAGKPMVEKEGTGTSRFKQVWWIGIGPTETLD